MNPDFHLFTKPKRNDHERATHEREHRAPELTPRGFMGVTAAGTLPRCRARTSGSITTAAFAAPSRPRTRSRVFMAAGWRSRYLRSQRTTLRAAPAAESGLLRPSRHNTKVDHLKFTQGSREDAGSSTKARDIRTFTAAALGFICTLESLPLAHGYIRRPMPMRTSSVIAHLVRRTRTAGFVAIANREGGANRHMKAATPRFLCTVPVVRIVDPDAGQRAPGRVRRPLLRPPICSKSCRRNGLHYGSAFIARACQSLDAAVGAAVAVAKSFDRRSSEARSTPNPPFGQGCCRAPVIEAGALMQVTSSNPVR